MLVLPPPKKNPPKTSFFLLHTLQMSMHCEKCMMEDAYQGSAVPLVLLIFRRGVEGEEGEGETRPWPLNIWEMEVSQLIKNLNSIIFFSSQHVGK